MDSKSNDKPFVPKWVLVTAAVAFLMIVGAVWWASAVSKADSNRIDIDRKPETHPADSAMGPAIRYPVVPHIQPTPYNNPIHSSKARVTVTPVEPTTNGSQPADKPTVKPAPSQKASATSQVRDMFPVGPILPTKTSEPVHQPVKQIAKQAPEPKPEPAEQFSSFTYGGKTWSFTGTFASSEQIETVATGFSTNGQEVYSLPGSGDEPDVLFVQSTKDSSKFAIYRGE
ncbi:MAG: hypothetical protein ABFD54_16285 [Armatimonadota bacterium]|nr:hypothetical protein [bacterium]